MMIVIFLYVFSVTIQDFSGMSAQAEIMIVCGEGFRA